VVGVGREHRGRGSPLRACGRGGQG